MQRIVIRAFALFYSLSVFYILFAPALMDILVRDASATRIAVIEGVLHPIFCEVFLAGIAILYGIREHRRTRAQ